MTRCATFAAVGAILLATTATGGGPPAGVDPETWNDIQAQIEAERHRITQSDRPERLYRADSPTQRFTAHFGSEDVMLVPRGRGEPAWELGLRLTAWGAAHDLKPVDFATATAEGNRVEYRRGPLTEWYVNTTMGLEQGFTIEAPPGDGIDELVLEMTLDTELIAKIEEGTGAVTFRRVGNNAVLSYTGLKVWDSVDRVLEGRMVLEDGGRTIRLAVSVAGAVWPVTIDPIFTQVAKLLPTPVLDGTYAMFGQVAAMDGDVMIVGIRRWEHGPGSGAAHIFRRDQGGSDAWGHVATITPSNPVPDDRFGWSVSIDGTTAVVGAHGDDVNGTDSGAVYVFERDHGGPDTWGQVSKITAAEVGTCDWFGRSVAISGNTIAVGAPMGDQCGANYGYACIFQRDIGGPSIWTEMTRITDSVGVSRDRFGSSVSIDGNTAVIGAPIVVPYLPEPGFAVVIERDQGGPDAWGEVARIMPSDGQIDDLFGNSVSISGDLVVVGARQHGNTKGAAYVFQRHLGGADTWDQAAKLTATDAETGDVFGGSVSISDDTAIVGAPFEDEHGSGSGSAYVFQRDQGGPGHWGQVTKIAPADGASGDEFGFSVAISGETAAVGAWWDDDNGTNSGSVYVIQRDHGGTGSWGQLAKLSCPPVYSARNHDFGVSVQISGDTAFVGAHGDDSSGEWSGAAYIFKRDFGGSQAWGKLVKITPDDGHSGDSFGYSVAIDGDTAIVGAYNDNVNGIYSGSAFIFQRDHGGADAWGQVAKIAPADGAANDYFGVSVSISNATAVIGAPLSDVLGSNSGSAYVFQRDQGGPDAWGQVARLIPLEGDSGESFGQSVSISGDTAFVGAYGDNENGPASGSAYVFHRDRGGSDAWGQVAKITPSDGTTYGFFGWSVIVNGDGAVVGAYGDDTSGPNSGSAYVFHRAPGDPDVWEQVAKLTANDGESSDRFGYSVAFSGDTTVVGANNDYVNGAASGSAYVFQRDHGGPDSWGQVAKITASDGADQAEFGRSVSVEAGIAIIGAPYDDFLEKDSGTAYVFTLSDAFFADGFESGDTSGWSVTVP